MKNIKELPYLDDIAHNIGDTCTKWGRITVTQTKEKYNTVRVYCGFGFNSLHGIIFPNYCYKHPKFPKWLWTLDIFYLSNIVSKLNFIVVPWQKLVYRYAYWKYIKKYPHLFDEITSCADHKEVLGFYLPKLCSHCSVDYKKSCYLGNETNCHFCKK